MTAQLPSRVYRIGNPENDDHCFTDNSKSAADAIKNGYEVSEYILAAHEQEPVRRVNADQMHRVCLEANRHLDKYGAMAKEINKLLLRHPAPVPAVPDAIKWPAEKFCPAEYAGSLLWNETEIWNKAVEACQDAYRAAMLNGGKS